MDTPQKFKPKFGQFGPKSSLKYSPVIITRVSNPRDIYVQLVDNEYSLYCKMKDELQKEFLFASSKSASFCSSPVIGHPYAVQYGEEWHRVSLEKSRKGEAETLHYVDLGRYVSIQPTMIFHNLPERYMELPAQSVWCTLHGVVPPYRKDFKTFPREINNHLCFYEGKPALAIFASWVPWRNVKLASKPKANVVLYPNGGSQSINIQLTQTSMAFLEFGYRCAQIDLPEHRKIRERLAAQSSDGILSAIAPVVPSVIASEEPTAAIDIRHANQEEVSIPVTYIGCRSPESIFFRTSELEIEFHSLHNAMSALFKDHEESSGDDKPILKIGLLYAVKFEGMWYRVKMIDSVKYPEITVYLIDKGSTRKVDANKIFRLPKEIKRAPKKVMQCSLFGVRPLGSEWTPKVTDDLRERLPKAEKIRIIVRQKDQLIGSDVDAGKTIPVTVLLYESCQAVTGSAITCTDLNKVLMTRKRSAEAALRNID